MTLRIACSWFCRRRCAPRSRHRSGPPPNREVPPPNVTFDAHPAVEPGASELADLLGLAREPAAQPADGDSAGQRARPRAEVGLSVTFAGPASGHAARRGRDDVHHPEPERRGGVERGHGKADLDLLPRAGSGGQKLLRTAVARRGDFRRHHLSGLVRRADDRHRCQDGTRVVEDRAGRRSEAGLRVHPRAARGQGQGDRGDCWRRVRRSRIHRGMGRQDREGGLALQHGARPRRTRPRELERRLLDARRRPDLGNRLVRSRTRTSPTGARAIPAPIGTARAVSATTCTAAP